MSFIYLLGPVHMDLDSFTVCRGRAILPGQKLSRLLNKTVVLSTLLEKLFDVHSAILDMHSICIRHK